MRNKVLCTILITALAIPMAACGSSTAPASNAAETIEDTADAIEDKLDEVEDAADAIEDKLDEVEESVENITINPSPDKYTYYIKNYVGKNLANIGYVSLGEELMDSYGTGYIKLVPITEDGAYIDIVNDEDSLKNYVVTAQDIDPNTELKFVFQTDEETGEEYDGLVRYQTYDEVVLLVHDKSQDIAEPVKTELTAINPSPVDDPHLYYIRDYVGRNLMFTGYTSLGGDRADAYGDGYIIFSLVTDDGEYIDVEDDAQMSQYYVVSQSVAPNTEYTMTFSTDEEGNEEYYFPESMNYEEIELTLKKVE